MTAPTWTLYADNRPLLTAGASERRMVARLRQIGRALAADGMPARLALRTADGVELAVGLQRRTARPLLTRLTRPEAERP